MSSSEYRTKRKDGKVRLAHVVLMEEVLGRPLEPDEVVHHINGIKDDNRLENLQLMNKREHSRLHHSGITPGPETVRRLREAHAGKISEKRKLTREQVREIADRLVKGERVAMLSREYAISKGTIAGIRDGKIYRDCLDDRPDSAFPLQQKRLEGHGNSTRKLDALEVGLIRVDLMEGSSVRSIAKRYGVSPSVIECIRDGETYQDIPWPKKEAEYYRTHNMEELAEILLSLPMSEKEDEYRALTEDYHLMPDMRSVTMLKMVRRAMRGGDTELALMLLLMGGYGEDLERLIREESVIWQTLLRDKV